MIAKPALDPQFVPIAEALAALPPLWSQSIQEARAAWDLSAFGTPEPVAQVRDLSIPVGSTRVGARFYAPNDAPSALLVYFHGGGWVLGNLETHDLPLRALANRTGAAILSVDYRLAPEHPFPTGLEDCYAALVWAAEHQAELTVQKRPLLVGGDSAGGNLAAAIALAARDRQGPTIACQLLFYPVIDGQCRTASYAERGDCALLTSDNMRWFWSLYVAEEAKRQHPLASPCTASGHRDLPPAIVAIAEFDPLRDEGLSYAEQLRSASNTVTVLRYPTLPHGFFNFLNLSETAGAAFREISEHVRGAIDAAEEEK